MDFCHLQAESWITHLNSHLEKILLNSQGYSVPRGESINRLEKQQEKSEMFWILRRPSRARVWRDKMIWPITNISLPNSLVLNALSSLLHCSVSCFISFQSARSFFHFWVPCCWPTVLLLILTCISHTPSLWSCIPPLVSS